jgi:hypothetical protein
MDVAIETADSKYISMMCKKTFYMV